MFSFMIPDTGKEKFEHFSKFGKQWINIDSLILGKN